MDRAKWIKAGLEIAEHLKALKRIAAENNIDQLQIAVCSSNEDSCWATYIEDLTDDGAAQYEVTVNKGKAKLSVDQDTYYIQT